MFIQQALLSNNDKAFTFSRYTTCYILFWGHLIPKWRNVPIHLFQNVSVEREIPNTCAKLPEQKEADCLIKHIDETVRW